MEDSRYVEDIQNEKLLTNIFLAAVIGLFSAVVCYVVDIPPPLSIVFHTILAMIQIVVIIKIFITLYVFILPVYKSVFGKFGFAVYVFVSTATALSFSVCHSNLCKMPSLLDILAQALCHVFFGSTPCPLLQ